MLLDHFHAPLSLRHDWHSFHNAWATVLAFDLNRQLPEGWHAAPNVQFGIEVDVGAFQLSDALVKTAIPVERPLETRTWEEGEPTLTLDFELRTDSVEVHVFDASEGRRLAGSIELVSPANKDRHESRDAFVSKCDWKLREGIGLVVVDIVTDRHANLHEALLTRLGHELRFVGAQLYAASYRVSERDAHPVLDVWHRPLEIGGELPVLSLHLSHGPRLQVDLESTYQLTRTNLCLN